MPIENASGWSNGPGKSSLPINGDLMRDLRKARGWTQEQLAALAGYSPRLIRKAESGSSVKSDTIEVLAAALSTPEAPVSPETLVSDPLGMVRAFAVAYAYDERQLAAKPNRSLPQTSPTKWRETPPFFPLLASTRVSTV